MLCTEINSYARRNEATIEVTALNPASIQESGIFTKDCQPSRGRTGGCPNKMTCRNKFAGLYDVIIEFRQLIFHGVGGVGTPNEGRRKNLENLLRLGRQDSPQGPIMHFTIQGVPVFKSFYRECTGLVRQFFEDVLNRVINIKSRSKEKTKKKRSKDSIPEHLKLEVVAILDRMFRVKKSKGDPTGKCEAMSIRSSWKDVFNLDFLRFTGGKEIVSYKQFCHVRYTERPYYEKSPRLKKSKFLFND